MHTPCQTTEIPRHRRGGLFTLPWKPRPTVATGRGCRHCRILQRPRAVSSTRAEPGNLAKTVSSSGLPRASDYD